MRLFLTLTFIISVLSINAQDTEHLNNNAVNQIFILDKYWKARAVTKFPTDGYPSFLSVQNGVVTLFSRSRDKRFAYESKIIEWEVNEENGIETIKFLGEQHYKNPTRPSFEITVENDKNVTIHLFQTLGGYDSYFSGHVATVEEIEALMKYLESN